MKNFLTLRRAIAKYCLAAILFFAIAYPGYTQSETHNFTTYDTIFVNGSFSWNLRISRPVNMFTANHPDTASRPAFINMQGQGEVGTDMSELRTHGIHYWLDHGWDGGVQLNNGLHYPILVTVMPRQFNGADWVNPRGPQIDVLINHILNTYHIKRNSVHFQGLSMGGFSWGKYIVYEASAGARTGMSKMTSLVALQGVSNESWAPYNAWSLGWNAFGTWAQEFNGKFFGLEGINDAREVWRVSENMNSFVPGSAYFAWENFNNGAHCCWNSMYNPNKKDWKNTGSPLGGNVTTKAGHANTAGTYIDGWSIYEWQLRQGDTSLVGVTAPIAVAGNDQVISLPTSQATLDGSGSTGPITSYTWTQVSGPNTPTMANGSSAIATIGATGTPLIQGTYVYSLTVSDGTNNDTDSITIQVNAASNIAPTADAGADQTIQLPTNQVTMAGSGADPDGSFTLLWTQVSGPNSGTITNPSSGTTTITGLIAGVYIFNLQATDNNSATGNDQVSITVEDTSTLVKRVNVNVYGGTNPYNNSAWNNWNSNASSTISNLNYEDGSTSTIDVAQTLTNGGAAATMPAADNGASYGGTMCPPEVLRYASYTTVGRNITISGLDNNKTYNLTFYASRANSGNNTNFTINGNTINLVTDNNLTNPVVFSTISPSSGAIVLTMIRGTGGTYTYLNGFVIEEVSASRGPVRVPVDESIVQEKEAKGISVFPNPINSTGINLSFANNLKGTVNISIIDQAGAIVNSWQFEKQDNLFTRQLNVQTLAKGVYFIKVKMNGYQEVKRIIK